ncbi:hypothetical protein [Pseudomonas aeruginosa]|uniref:hypothetical protein n=1 Tax=Pseudomonas aeruginosa TaxID=287 RepID=UPI0021E7E022|nr:hypothetical protein [Pseudomonas aeruginosa]MCV3836363.1 hypothetical protein [Pseudomonas aeruginosa]MDP5728912.1 hypothetical protein [Pseudomonas aeruginosa]HCI2338800.1 hypothetical protein [Pseudomonas aeruginosa]
MSCLVLQCHANLDVSNADLIRHIGEQRIAVCVSRIGLKTASIAISAQELMKILLAELVPSWT